VKILAILVIAFLILKFIDVTESSTSRGIRTTFALMDTTGAASTTFKSGDNFIMQCSLTNETGKDQAYSVTGPSVTFEIWSNNSRVVSDVDGLMFTQVVQNAVFRNGRTETYSWRAPQPISRSPKKYLTPGEYSARTVVHMGFRTNLVNRTSSIAFKIIL
jgi:hypothetical protein